MGHFDGYGRMMNGFGFPAAILMFASWALIIATLLLGAVWFARYVGPVSRDSASPLDILKKRYAKGEIAKEEFDAIKKDLAA